MCCQEMREIAQPIIQNLVLAFRPIKIALSEAQNKFVKDCGKITSRYEAVFAEIKEEIQ
jgi:hypothetical protein